jgi:hypothetical protein
MLLKSLRAMEDDKVDPSYFTLYFVEGSEFISTQLNPARWSGYFEHYGDQGKTGQRQLWRPN